MTEKHVMLPTSEVLDQIVVEFHKLTSNIYEIPPAKANEEHYRQVIVKGWPRNIHFEFISRKNSAKGKKAGLSLELHDENGGFLRLKELIPKIAQSIGLRDDDIYWKNPALVKHISYFETPSKAAESMLELISNTKDSISLAIGGVRQN